MDSNQNLSIKNWAEEDRPREKLLLKGNAALSDAELLGILIGSGTKTLSAVDLAKLILKESGNDLHKLARLTVKDLMKFKGIGEARAITIVSALELGRRRKMLEPTERLSLKSAHQAYLMVKDELEDLAHEEFWIILTKRNLEVIKKVKISSGGVSGTLVDPRLIFKSAIEELASGIFLIHNHPSGSLRPSEEDKMLTRRLKQIGDLLNIAILDHIIVSDVGFYSFVNENQL